MKYFLLIAAGSLLLQSCSEPETPSLEEFNSWTQTRYVDPFKAGDIDAWMTLFDEEAIALHNLVPPSTNKSAIRQFGDFVAENVIVENMFVELKAVQSNGDWALTWGTYESNLLLKETGEVMPGHNPKGKVLLLWARQHDGDWRVLADMGNELPRSNAR